MNEWNQKLRVARDYNRTAHLYDIRYTIEQIRKMESTVEVLQPKNQMSVLDIGCGTGLLIKELKSTGKCAWLQTFVGLDLSKKMLKQAEEFGKSFADVHFVLADADHSPLRGGRFDVVFAFTLLQNMPAPSHTLREAQRVMKESGVLAVTGLKSYLAQRAFVEMLRKAKLDVKLVEAREGLRDHIAICRGQV